jgi:hypothetical protein
MLKEMKAAEKNVLSLIESPINGITVFARKDIKCTMDTIALNNVIKDPGGMQPIANVLETIRYDFMHFISLIF